MPTTSVLAAAPAIILLITSYTSNKVDYPMLQETLYFSTVATVEHENDDETVSEP